MHNLNSYPYFDDYDSTKGFHKILFHPAKPVQARELTQMQTILQEQIKRHGDHIFKNGTVVIPGHLFYDDKAKYIKLETVYNQTNIETHLPTMVGKEIKGDTNSITALVVHYDVKTATEPTTVYIKYTAASGAIKEFKSGETLTCPEIAGLTFKILPVTEYTGASSLCTISDGVYYVNGFFVGVAKQTITISKYNKTASAVVGLQYVENIITENEDPSLYDNALGFTNYGAPGAHRLQIKLLLESKSYDYTAVDTAEIKFIDLLKIKNGNIEYLKDNTKYAEIEKWLARRTFEESGNYSVKPFKFNAYELRNNDRGAWVTNTPYLKGDIVSNAGKDYIAMNQGYSGSTAPIQSYDIQSDGVIYWNQLPDKSTFVNGGKTSVTSTKIDDHISAASNFAVETSAGKAYVNGFEIEFNAPSMSVIPKARTTKQLTQAQLYAPAGSYVVINNVKGIPNVTTNLTKINLLDVAGATIGTAWVRSLEYLSGSLATPATVEYRLFLFNIAMNSGKNFAINVHTISSAVFSGDVKPTLSAISGSASASASTTVTGVGSYFDFELRVGDRVKVGATWTSVASITSPTVFVATSSVTAAAGSTIYKGTSDSVRLGDYVTELPSKSINTLRDSVGAIDMTYVVSKYYAITTVGTSYAITLTNGETFLPTEHIVILDTGTLGTSLPVNATYSLDTPATTLTISGLSATTNYKMLLLVKRTGSFAKEKSKTLATKTITLNNTGTQTFNNKTISLTEADCVRLTKVTESGDPADKVNYVSAGETDITRYFTFDSGQHAEYYDVGKIKTTRSNTRPLRITFEYFVHSSGDYFSADSYSSIPEFMIGTTTIGNKDYYLPDCLDFRSRIADSGLTFDTAGGASISDPLLSEMTMSTSYSYYLPRVDTLGIDISGGLSYNIGGNFSAGMQLCTINVAPYTKKPTNDVVFSDDQIVNYTMKDLKSIDSRLTNVEYYVALSELEKTTVNTSIKDEFGIERDKNGFLVDEFANHDASDLFNVDYKAAVDLQRKECRALSTSDGAHLIEPIGATDASRLASGYQITGSILTLPYTEESVITQTLASRSEAIQAYSNLDFTGHMKIYPDSDAYTDEKYDTAITTSVAAPRTDIINSTSTVYGGYGWGGYGAYWYGYYYGWNQTASETSTSSSTSTSTVTSVTKDFWTNASFKAPKLRARTIVVHAKKLKPFTAMNVFLSSISANTNYVPCTVVNISSAGTFVGGETNQQNDKLDKRTTTVNSYDVIQRGDVITCTSGSAVVVSDETIFDKATSLTKRVLYVCNVKGTLSGTITGSITNASATVISVAAGTRETNSEGNMYGVISIPSNTYDSGNHKILISDDANPNPNAATTLADAQFSSNGIVNTHTRHLNYESQNVTTVKNVTTNTYSNYWYYDGGGG